MSVNWQQAIRYLGGSPEEEQKIFSRLAKEVRQEILNIAKSDPAGKKQKPQHAKTLVGIQNAIFRIADDLSDDLQVGFLQPGQAYPARIRFSNASAFVRDDAQNDLRGAAIEVVPDQGSVQHFLMTNAECHHARDAVEAMATSLAFYKEGTLNKIIGITRLATHTGTREAYRIVKTVTDQARIPVESLATETYWSRSPLRIGSVVAKYRLAPVIPKNPPAHTPPDLTSEFGARLAKSEVRFLFQVQRYLDEQQTPLEDATKAWHSPQETIAEVIVPQQELHPEIDHFSGFHFNPWQVNSSDFEPLGNMNRARKVVYAASVDTQHS